MNKMQALHAFWSSFGWTAIDEQSAYDEGALDALGDPDRYITYEAAASGLGEPVPLSASLWDRSPSWAAVETMAARIYDAIGQGGVKVDYDGGQIWITRGSPFSRRGPVAEDLDLRRIQLKINAEFLSA